MMDRDVSSVCWEESVMKSILLMASIVFGILFGLWLMGRLDFFLKKNCRETSEDDIPAVSCLPFFCHESIQRLLQKCDDSAGEDHGEDGTDADTDNALSKDQAHRGGKNQADKIE